MSRIEFSIPIALELTSEEAWQTRDTKGTDFFIARYHFSMFVSQKDEPTSHGEKIATFKTPDGVSATHIQSIDFEHTQIDVEQSVQQGIASSNLMLELTDSLSANIGSKNFLGIGGKVNVKSAESIINRFSNELSITRTLANTKKETHEVKFEIDKHTNKTMVLVEGFQRCRATISLSYIDYLQVKYDVSFFGIRKKRNKRPSIARNNKKRNIIKINKEVIDVEFWKSMTRSAILVPETEYKKTVLDPQDVTILSPSLGVVNSRGFPKKIPSLYQIANAAFPLNWSKRNCSWTEDELKKIEEEDKKSSIRFMKSTHEL